MLEGWHAAGSLDNFSQPQKLGATDMMSGSAQNMNPTPNTLMPLKEAARRLAVTPRTLYREIAAGRFPRVVKVGRSSRVLESDYAAYLAALVSKRTT